MLKNINYILTSILILLLILLFIFYDVGNLQLYNINKDIPATTNETLGKAFDRIVNKVNNEGYSTGTYQEMTSLKNNYNNNIIKIINSQNPQGCYDFSNFYDIQNCLNEYGNSIKKGVNINFDLKKLNDSCLISSYNYNNYIDCILKDLNNIFICDYKENPEEKQKCIINSLAGFQFNLSTQKFFEFEFNKQKFLTEVSKDGKIITKKLDTKTIKEHPELLSSPFNLVGKLKKVNNKEIHDFLLRNQDSLNLLKIEYDKK